MIAEWRGIRVSLDAFIVNDPIQLEGRDARANVGSGDVENLAAELCEYIERSMLAQRV